MFIQEFSGDTDYSRQNRLQSSLAKCGEATDGTNNDIRCNIYDMAGNTQEWSTETSSNSPYYCVARGGNYNITDYYTSSHDNNRTNSNSEGTSFRPILYL